MKKLLAMLLSLVMLFALVPFAVADNDADYTLVIGGGNVNEHLEVVGGNYALAVDVTLKEAAQEPIFSLTFGLTYDAAQLTFVKCEANEAFALPTVNDTEEGALRFALVSIEGIPAAEEMQVVTLYFEVAGNLAENTQIAFALENDGFVETTDTVRPVRHNLVSDFAPYTIPEGNFTGVVKFNEGEVQYKGATPYVVWNYDKHEPAFTVYEADGETVIAPENYDFEYKENQAPGTGYLFVTFKGAYTGQAMLWFKIYLPATTKTTVENVSNGIKISWEAVEDAAGYVIYRRAWSTTTDGWTTFERWNNTTATTWIDETVYAGTRYQYGIKAYFARRVDPVSGATIGGNVGDNFNLGMVGPLKTTVRITTRKLTAVEAGNGQMTIKWEPTKNFTGIQVQYAEDANFKTNSKNYKIPFELDGAGNVIIVKQDVIKDLTSGKTYYVRIRSYHIFEGMNYYGEWSEVKNCKVN